MIKKISNIQVVGELNAWEVSEGIFASNPEYLFKYATEILNDELPAELEAAYALHEQPMNSP